MNTKLTITLILSLILGLSPSSSPARAESLAQGSKPTAVHLAKLKAMYLPVRAMDQKAFAALRQAINTSDASTIAKTNETVFLTAARLINAYDGAFAYAYTNGIYQDETVKAIMTCFHAVSSKYQDLVQAIYDDSIYYLDPVDDPETIDELVFASHSVSWQEEHCGPVETLFRIR